MPESDNQKKPCCKLYTKMFQQEREKDNIITKLVLMKWIHKDWKGGDLEANTAKTPPIKFAFVLCTQQKNDIDRD